MEFAHNFFVGGLERSDGREATKREKKKKYIEDS